MQAVNSIQEKLKSFERLLTIMDELRAKCPWDKKQSFESLSYLTIEETYELTDAILEKDLEEIKGEIGDLMLHMVFYSKLGSEVKAFDVADVLNTVCDKLVERHPHIYGDVIAETEEEVKANWEQIKIKKSNKSVLAGVPKSLPSMVKATRIQEKARGVGFDWDNKEQVFEKVQEEFKELHVEIDQNNQDKIEDEFGDVLFSMINYARFIGVDPESALERTNKKFIKRFQYLEDGAKAEGKAIASMSLDEMNAYWEAAKKK